MSLSQSTPRSDVFKNLTDHTIYIDDTTAVLPTVTPYKKHSYDSHTSIGGKQKEAKHISKSTQYFFYYG